MFAAIGGRRTTNKETSRPLKVELAPFPAAAHVIAPAKDFSTIFGSVVPAFSGPIGYQRDLSVSQLDVEIDVWLGPKAPF